MPRTFRSAAPAAALALIVALGGLPAASASGASSASAGFTARVRPDLLLELIPGVPGRGSVRRMRRAFAPNEKMAVQGTWEPQAEDYAVDFAWIGPDGKTAHSSRMKMKKEYRRTLVSYRGPRPAAAGKWRFEARLDGRLLGDASFIVVRKASEIPLKRHIRALKAGQLTGPEADWVLVSVREHLRGRLTLDGLPDSLPRELAGRGVQVALSLFKDGRLVHSRLGIGETLRESLGKAASGAREAEPDPDVIEASFVHKGIEIPASPTAVRIELREPAGFSLAVGDRRATLLPITIARLNLITPEGVLRQAALEAGLEEDAWRGEGASLTSFRAQDFILRRLESTSRRLAYSREAVDPSLLEHAGLRHSVREAVRWYVRNQRPDGSYMYDYFPSRGAGSGDDWALRGLNALFVLAELSRELEDPDLRASVGKAAALYAGAVVNRDGRRILVWTKDRHTSSVAATAFLLGALAELGRREDLPLMRRLADSVLGMQLPSGRMRTEFLRKEREVDQLYYPGETFLGLLRYHKLTGDKRAVELVERAFPYYRAYWDKRKEGPFVPWQVRAYAELYELTRDPAHRDFAFDMQDWLLRTYKPVSRRAPSGRRGALERQYASTAVYSEGLAAAYKLARDTGDVARRDRYARALKGMCGYLIGLQHSGSAVYWMKEPGKARGAMALRPDYSELRLDATYHAVSGIHMASKLFTPEEWRRIR